MYFSIWKIGEFHLWILCFRYSHISKLSLAIFIANPCRTSISIDFLIRYADLQRFVLNFFFVTIIKKCKNYATKQFVRAPILHWHSIYTKFLHDLWINAQAFPQNYGSEWNTIIEKLEKNDILCKPHLSLILGCLRYLPSISVSAETSGWIGH